MEPVADTNEVDIALAEMRAFSIERQREIEIMNMAIKTLEGKYAPDFTALTDTKTALQAREAIITDLQAQINELKAVEQDKVDVETSPDIVT